MLPSSIPLDAPEIAKVEPKDTDGDRAVKHPPRLQHVHPASPRAQTAPKSPADRVRGEQNVGFNHRPARKVNVVGNREAILTGAQSLPTNLDGFRSNSKHHADRFKFKPRRTA